MKIAVFGKQYHSADRDVLQTIFRSLRRHNIRICVDAEFYAELHKDSGLLRPDNITLISEHDFSADLALSIGGDGTFLHTAAKIGEKQIPILGINTGRLGFLTDLSGANVENGMEEICNNHFYVEERSVLQVQAAGLNQQIWPFALNEVALLKQDSASMISIRASINNEYFNTYQADGLVIATPTGSTAYALSVGGPVLVPQAANWVLAPVAPHSFTVRPLVVNDDVSISLTVTSRTGNFLLSCDGRSILLQDNQAISLHKASFAVKVVKSHNHSFSETLRTKLMWGADKRY